MKILGAAVEVPAGYYFTGDPWLAVPVSLWTPLLEATGFWRVPVGEIGRYQVLAFRAHGGRGVYRDQEYHKYTSLSGLLGVVPVAMYSGSPETLRKVGRLVTWGSPVVCTSDGFGGLKFGPYYISTRTE